uniref:Uncharacterized protein n=1 Tax=Arion vulgaris TaxID=1028688 RepID=A0A0B6YHD7_9EUPU
MQIRSSMMNMIPNEIIKKTRRHVFSLSAPMQPVKLMLNMDIPTTINRRAGSRAIFVSLVTFWYTSFSAQAQSPIASNMKPIIQNRTLNPNIRYFMQQLTSVLSLRDL